MQLTFETAIAVSLRKPYVQTTYIHNVNIDNKIDMGIDDHISIMHMYAISLTV